MLLSRSCPVARCSVPSKPHCRAPVVLARAAPATVDVETKVAKKEAEAKPEEAELPDVQVSTKEVQSFLNNLVTGTNIAELHLQVGSFELKVRRSTGLPAAAAAAAAAPAAPAAPAYNGPQIVITKAPPAEMTVDQTVDESLVTINAPKVGIFRRGKYAGGKRVGKGNAVNTGDQVKRGQVLGYVEQLGTFVPVEAPQAGELVSFFVEDGAPVEYKQDVCELAPYFGGHIIGDSKYA